MSLQEKLEQQKLRWKDLEPWIKRCCITERYTVLDIGCGVGYITSKVAKYCKYIKGIDKDIDNIRLAKTRVSFVEQRDIIIEELPNCEWDLILYLGVHHKIIHKIERLAILNRIFHYAKYNVIIRIERQFTLEICELAFQYNFSVIRQNSTSGDGPLFICSKNVLD